MRILSTVFGVILLASFTSAASAQLIPYKDYTVSEEIVLVTTVRVHPNMDDDYLEGLRDTWIASNKVAKELGQIKDFAIYRSDLPQSGDFNLVLSVTLASTADLAPSKERYDAFMKKWGEKRNEMTREIAKNYPKMRDITGSYMMRRVTVN